MASVGGLISHSLSCCDACKIAKDHNKTSKTHSTNFQLVIQARIAQLVAYRLGTGSNPIKGENFSMKISN